MNALRSAGGLFAVAALVVLPATSASAAVIARYDFGSNAGSPSFAASVSDANVTAGSITFPSTVARTNLSTLYYSNVTAPFQGIARNSGGNSTGANATPTPNQSGYYVEFVVTPAAGYELDLQSASFAGAQGGGAANTRGYAIYTSVDGVALQTNSAIGGPGSIASGTFNTVRGTTTTPTVLQTYAADLSAAKYQDLTGPLTVRYYFSSVDQGQNVDVDDFVLAGTVSQIVPEPTTLAALAGVGLVALRRRRA